MIIKDSVALVTGGASGLGEACVRKLVANGAKVAMFDLQEDRGKKLEAELGPNALFIKTDVTSEAGVTAAINETVERLGGLRIAINCAGTGAPMKLLSKKGPHSLEMFSKIIQINTIGTFNVIRLAAVKMVENEPGDHKEKGVIINTASVAAFDGQIGQASYSASKGAIVGMTLPIARECAEYGIRVLTIAPGIFDTPLLGSNLTQDVRDSLNKMVPFPKRMGDPAEYAGLACHIIENQYLNGEVIRLDGAIRMAAK